VDAQGQVLTRDELLDTVWHGQVVEERKLTIQISLLRKAMGDLPNGEDPIRTVSRVGYRLMLDGEAPRAHDHGAPANGGRSAFRQPEQRP
jgi:DNA-binding winged helix-turn-helix (wHTH) protein